MAFDNGISVRPVHEAGGWTTAQHHARRVSWARELEEARRMKNNQGEAYALAVLRAMPLGYSPGYPLIPRADFDPDNTGLWYLDRLTNQQYTNAVASIAAYTAELLFRSDLSDWDEHLAKLLSNIERSGDQDNGRVWNIERSGGLSGIGYRALMHGIQVTGMPRGGPVRLNRRVAYPIEIGTIDSPDGDPQGRKDEWDRWDEKWALFDTEVAQKGLLPLDTGADSVQ